MHQNDCTILNLFLHGTDNLFCVLHFPVQCIDRPEYRQHLHTKFQIFLPGTKRRAQVQWINTCCLIDQIICFQDFFPCLRLIQFIQLYMMIGMVSYQMPFFLHPFYKLRILFNLLSKKKKRNSDIPLFQTIQKKWCIPDIRSVVKCQCRLRMLPFFHSYFRN